MITGIADEAGDATKVEASPAASLLLSTLVVIVVVTTTEELCTLADEVVLFDDAVRRSILSTLQ